MKKYYCADCKKFKHRWQLRAVDDTRIAWLTCGWCHGSNIYETEDIINKLIKKSFTKEELKRGI